MITKFMRFIFYRLMVPIARNMDDGPKEIEHVRKQYAKYLDE